MYGLNNVLTGCVFNSVWINHVFYVDDAVLLAPTPQVMQTPLKICDEFAAVYRLTYNIKKMFCICVRPKLFNICIQPIFK